MIRSSLAVQKGLLSNAFVQTFSTSSSERLIKAAEELATAAVAETQNSTLSVTKQMVAGIEETVDELKSLRSESKAMKESLEAKMNSMNQNLADLKTSIEVLSRNQVESNKIERLKSAFDRVDAVQDFYCLDEKGRPYDDTPYLSNSGKTFLKDVLFSFWKGQGRFVSCYFLVDTSRLSFEAAKETFSKQFQDHVSLQIHTLTGVKPRIQKENDGRYTIWYE